MEPFRIKDCALALLTTGCRALNLRELLEGVVQADDDTIYHHFYEPLLRSTFDDPEYHNDFAVWARRDLHDLILAERLSIIDPYLYHSIDELRNDLTDLIEERLSETPYIPWAHPGHDFTFMKACTIIFATEWTIASPAHLYEAVKAMTLSSIFFHFVEARRREPLNVDDFSTWIEGLGPQYQPYHEALSKVEYGFLSLSEMKQEILSQLKGVG